MAQKRHGFSAQVTERDFNNRATRWAGKCGRHAEFFGDTYEAIEDEWRRHVHAETGSAPAPLGDKADRWMPAVSA